MFIRNPTSIKRKTICVDNDTKQYLVRCGYSPVSKNHHSWVYITSDEVVKLRENYRGGDG